MKTLRFGSIILALALVAGCALGPRHAAVVIDQSIYTGLTGIQRAADAACADANPDPAILDCKGPLSTAKRQAFAAQLIPALEAGRDLNRVIAAWQPGTPVPTQLTNIVERLKVMLANLADDIPGLADLRTSIGSTTARVMDLLITLLALKGN